LKIPNLGPWKTAENMGGDLAWKDGKKEKKKKLIFYSGYHKIGSPEERGGLIKKSPDTFLKIELEFSSS